MNRTGFFTVLCASMIAASPGLLLAADNRPIDPKPSDTRSIGTTTQDAAITATVKTKLLADPDVAGLKIDVDTRNKIVTLSGTVASEMQVTRAGEIATAVDGVASVNNQLRAAQ